MTVDSFLTCFMSFMSTENQKINHYVKCCDHLTILVELVLVWFGVSMFLFIKDSIYVMNVLCVKLRIEFIVVVVSKHFC